MLLKSVACREISLLIAPKGIEIFYRNRFVKFRKHLLIAPKGIEILASLQVFAGYTLLIAPKGIEMKYGLSNRLRCIHF